MSLGLLLLLLYFIFRPKVNKLQEILKKWGSSSRTLLLLLLLLLCVNIRELKRKRYTSKR